MYLENNNPIDLRITRHSFKHNLDPSVTIDVGIDFLNHRSVSCAYSIANCPSSSVENVVLFQDNRRSNADIHDTTTNKTILKLRLGEE